MTKAFKSLLFLGCSCIPASAQTPDACQAAVRHLTLPVTAEYAPMHVGLPLSPIEFLYSSRGIDFYAVIFSELPNYYPVVGIYPHSAALILVYQDEEARQQIITTLRDGHLIVRQSDATAPSLDNLKFAVIHCVPGEKDFLSTGRCVVNDVQYYKPQPCIVVPQAKTAAELSILAGSGARNYRDAINALNWLTGVDNIPSMSKVKGESPPSFDISATARAKLKEFAARNQSR
jgi:hypothetical protein